MRDLKLILRARLRLLSLFLYFVFIQQILNAQIPLPPKLKCVSVDEFTGNVRITWDSVTVNGQFDQYKIYRSNGGAFEFALPEYENDSFCSKLDLIDARLQSHSYYITTYYQGGGGIESLPSDTLHTMLVSVVPIEQNSIASVTWNEYKNSPNINSSTGRYVIYRRPEFGVFTAVGSVPFGTENYKDTIFGTLEVGCDSIKFQYQIGISDTIGCPFEIGGCESLSAVSNFAIFIDNLGPDKPVLETATVNALGVVEVYWYPSAADDVAYYIVQNAENFTTVGTVNSPNTTTQVGFVDIDNPQSFLVIAFDACGNDKSFLNTHTVVHLENEFTECKREVFLNWTPYLGWADGVKKYSVEVQYNGGLFIFVDSTSATEFTHKVDTTGEFCYRIISHSNGLQRNSYSNTVCQEVTYPDVNEFTYLSTVDVLSNTAIEIRALVDTNVIFTKYELYRTEDLAEDFDLIATINQLPFQNFVSYVDNNVTTFDKKYYYHWKSYDVCDNFVAESNTSTNIRLTAAANPENFSTILQWHPYLNWDGEVESYNVYRKNIFTNTFDLISNQSAQSRIYFENVEFLSEVQGGFCYILEAVEFQNSFGIAETARSNESCAIQPPIFWVPNAMVIDGFNNEFKPTALFLDFSKYKLEIYNRWSQLIFTSNTYSIGWDGKYKGDTVKSGAYAFYISYVDGNGQSQAQAGTVFVLE
jgi:gliding motility-associated-like protein